MTRVALYLRVSKDKKQRLENQRRELKAAAKRHGWTIAAEFSDKASGAGDKLDKRPGFKALRLAVARREFDIVAAWSVDRIGRSLLELLKFLDELEAKQLGLYLHTQGVDTKTPAGRAFMAMAGMFSEYERERIIERVKAGQARARVEGKVIGRPKTKGPVEAAIRRDLKRKGRPGIIALAGKHGVGVSVVQRIRSEISRK